MESHDGDMIETNNKSEPASLDLFIAANPHNKMGATPHVNLSCACGDLGVSGQNMLSEVKFSLHSLRALRGSVRRCIFSGNGAGAHEPSDGSASHPYLGIDWRREFS